MDIVYYHMGEPLLIVESKRKHKSHKAALREAQAYRKNFPVTEKGYAPSGKAPIFLATTVGDHIQFYKDIFIVKDNQLKQHAEPIEHLKFSDLLEFYGLVAEFRARKLTAETFSNEFISELLRLYDVGGQDKISPELIVKISMHLTNYLADSKKYKHKKPFIDLDDYLLRRKGIADLHRRYDLLGSLGPDIGNAYRRFILRAFQGTPLNQYLTPQSVICFMLDICKPLVPSSRVIDFECGSGGYLVAAMERGDIPMENVLGIDIDRKPIIFAKTFLALTLSVTGKHVNNIPLKKGNGLIYDGRKWDFVIGNPSGSDKYKRRDLDEVLKHLNRDLDQDGRDDRFTEYNFSIQQAVRLAKPGGIICLVVPEGLLSNSNDQFLRDFLSRNCKVLAIVSLPRGTFRKGKTTKAGSTGGQTATMKMNILLAKKIRNKRELPDDYPIFLAQIYDSKTPREDVDSWLKPKLDLVYEQWLIWNNTGKLRILEEQLLMRAAASEVKAVHKKTLFKDPDQQELLS